MLDIIKSFIVGLLVMCLFLNLVNCFPKLMTVTFKLILLLSYSFHWLSTNVSHRSSHRKLKMPPRVPPCGWILVWRRVQSWHMSVKLRSIQSHFPPEPGDKLGWWKLKGLFLTITSSVMTRTKPWGLVRWAHLEQKLVAAAINVHINENWQRLLKPVGILALSVNTYGN